MEANEVKPPHSSIASILGEFRKRNPNLKNRESGTLTEADIIRLLSHLILARLENQLNEHTPGEEGKSLWGKDETALSVLVKITQVLTKLSELERREQAQEKPTEKHFHISDSDIKRLKDYARRLEAMDDTHPSGTAAQ